MFRTLTYNVELQEDNYTVTIEPSDNAVGERPQIQITVKWSDIKTHKLSYLSRFKDNDSYNDYIIKLDNIIGLNNAPIEQREEDENANEEEMINSQLKEKEESFTNS